MRDEDEIFVPNVGDGQAELETSDADDGFNILSVRRRRKERALYGGSVVAGSCTSQSARDIVAQATSNATLSMSPL